MKEIIKKEILESIQVKQKLFEEHIETIETISKLIVECFQNNKKLLLCGNGGSACDASHIAAELVVRFKSSNERRALPALCLNSDFTTLTACSNDYGYNKVFERQIEAFGMEEDVLWVFSTSGNSQNIYNAVQKAKEMNLSVIAFLGGNGGKISSLLSENKMIVPSDITARIQESHIMLGHILCSIAEKKLFNLS